jgi:hypothetical protein
MIIQGDVRVVLDCAECGLELKEAELEFGDSIDHDCLEKPEDEEPQFEEVDTKAVGTARYENVIKRGKYAGREIKNMRYMPHMYGAEITVTFKCKFCGQEFDQTCRVEEQFSNFNEL